MNIHHLELFYYVARHGGVSAAARHIPYGIQQPAISAQVIRLEDDLGAALFTRRPFKLTKTGEELFRFIEPFFGQLDDMGRRLRGGGAMSLRIGALETIQREYLPRLLKAMRRRFSNLHFSLMPARLEQIEKALLAQEIDFGIAPLLGSRAEGVQQKEFVQVPMSLLVPATSRLRSAEELWQQDRIAEPLISGPGDTLVNRLFQAELRKRKLEWFPSIELNSPELVARYVTEGFGIGLVLAEPGVPPPKGPRVLPLEGFPTVPYGLLWTGLLSPLQLAFMEETEALVGALRAPVEPTAASTKKRSSRAGGRKAA